jgi:hypothetical protein
MQVNKLSTLDRSDEIPRSLVRHLRATGVIDDDQIPAPLIDLYRRYRREWLLLTKQACKDWNGRS